MADFSAVISDIEDVKQELHDEVEDAVDNWTTELEAEIIRTVGRKDVIWKARILNSISKDKERLGPGKWRFTISAGGPKAPHAKYQEFGTGVSSNLGVFGVTTSPRFAFRPHSSPPPVDKIHEWVKDEVQLAPGENSLIVALEVARRIRVRGTKPQPFMRPALVRLKSQLEPMVARGVRKATR